MGLLRALARVFLVNRLLRRRPPPFPPGGARRGRVGLFGPVPYYSTTTRRGTRVSVGGCCLPIPLFVVAAMTAAGLFVRRRFAGRWRNKHLGW